MDAEWTRNGPGMDPVPTTNKFSLLAGEDIDVSLTETVLPAIEVNETVSLVKNSPIGKSIDGDTQTTRDEPAVTSVNVNPEFLSAGNSEANVNPVTAPSPSRGEAGNAGNVKMDVLRETPKVLYNRDGRWRSITLLRLREAISLHPLMVFLFYQISRLFPLLHQMFPQWKST